MVFLIKNCIREIKCYIKTYWWFLLGLLFGCFLLLNLQKSMGVGFVFAESKTIVTFSVVIVLWGYAYLGKYPLILMNPANFIYREWHKNNRLLIVNYIGKSMSIMLLLYTILRLWIKENFLLFFIQSIFLVHIAFLIKWQTYHEEKIKLISLIGLSACSTFYILEVYYWGIIFEVLCCLFLIFNLPKLNVIKYFNDLKFIYANKSAAIRGDFTSAAKFADDYNSRKEYGLALRKEHLKWAVIGKSIYIDTFRASTSGWVIKVILLLLMVIMEVIKWDSVVIMNVASLLTINALCLLIANEYFFYFEKLVDNSRKGLFLPRSSIELTISSITIPSVFISLAYSLYCFLSGQFLLVLFVLVLINIVINFLQFSTVFMKGKKKKLITLSLNIIRVGVAFYLFL